MRRRLLPLALLALVVLSVTLPLTLSRSTHSSPATSTTLRHYGLLGHPSEAQQRAVTAASKAYRQLIMQAGQKFGDAVTQLDAATSAGDLAGARTALRKAQMAYDTLRGHIDLYSVTDLEIDGLMGQQPSTMGRRGLHAVEQDLYGGDITLLKSDVDNLRGSALMIVFGLGHTIKTPEQILDITATTLHWALDRAISTPHEQFCHCDIIDVRAVVDAAQTSTNAALLLAKHVATHGDADAVRRALDRLVRDTHHLGSLTTSDAQISHSQWRRIAIDIDALTPRLTTLAGDFYGYGTGRLYA